MPCCQVRRFIVYGIHDAVNDIAEFYIVAHHGGIAGPSEPGNETFDPCRVNVAFSVLAVYFIVDNPCLARQVFGLR